MKLLRKLFGSKENPSQSQKGQIIRITVNDKIMPIDRGFEYEDPMDEILKTKKLGEISGGGTLQKESGEIEYIDIEIFTELEVIDKEFLGVLKTNMEKFGAPKGSKIVIEETGMEIEIGKNEGIGIYLDGVNLPKEVYANNDVNELIEKLRNNLNDQGETLRYWQGAEETALYFYDSSFVKMKEQISNIIETHPLCENAKIIQIA